MPLMSSVVCPEITVNIKDGRKYAEKYKQTGLLSLP
jgi:hypothetical protein